MQLHSYISDLLYRYDCVTVPDFGAFLSTKSSAAIDANTNTLYPPQKQLAFNEQLQHNDGLLANYIAEVEKVPYTVAVNKISKHVRTIKSYLIEGETITFKNIGDILLNSEGHMVFDPSNDMNYLKDAFGLASFQSEKLYRDVYREKVEGIEEIAPLAITPRKRTTQPYLKYAAVAVIALMLGGVGGASYYSNEINNQNQLAQKQATAQLDTKIQEATFVIENPLPAITLNVDKQSGNYYIVAGAFRVKENSIKKIKQLRLLGYKARSIGANRFGLFEVVYSSYDTRTEAQQALRKIKYAHNSDAWLLVKELKAK